MSSADTISPWDELARKVQGGGIEEQPSPWDALAASVPPPRREKDPPVGSAAWRVQNAAESLPAPPHDENVEPTGQDFQPSRPAFGDPAFQYVQPDRSFKQNVEAGVRQSVAENPLTTRFAEDFPVIANWQARTQEEARYEPASGVGGFIGGTAAGLFSPTPENIMFTGAGSALGAGAMKLIGPVLGRIEGLAGAQIAKAVEHGVGGAGTGGTISGLGEAARITDKEWREDPWGSLARIGKATAEGAAAFGVVGAAHGALGSAERGQQTTPSGIPKAVPDRAQGGQKTGVTDVAQPELRNAQPAQVPENKGPAPGVAQPDGVPRGTPADTPRGTPAEEIDPRLARVLQDAHDAIQRGETPTPVPESPATIAAQVDGLTSGKRPAMLVTPGEAMPAVPEGFQTLKTDAGVFVFDPEKVNRATIRQAVKDGTIGEVLGYGIADKPTPGTEIGAVTVRTPDGVEKQSVITDEASLPRVTEAARAVAEPGDTIKLENLLQVIKERVEAGAKTQEEARSLAEQLKIGEVVPAKPRRAPGPRRSEPAPAPEGVPDALQQEGRQAQGRQEGLLTESPPRPPEARGPTPGGAETAPGGSESQVLADYLAKHDAEAGQVPARKPYLPARDEAFAREVNSERRAREAPASEINPNMEPVQEAIATGERLGYRPEDIAAYLRKNYQSVVDTVRATGLESNSPGIENMGPGTGWPREGDPKPGDLIASPKGAPGSKAGMTQIQGGEMRVLHSWRTAGPKGPDEVLHVTLQAPGGEQFNVGEREIKKYTRRSSPQSPQPPPAPLKPIEQKHQQGGEGGVEAVHGAKRTKAGRLRTADRQLTDTDRQNADMVTVQAAEKRGAGEAILPKPEVSRSAETKPIGTKPEKPDGKPDTPSQSAPKPEKPAADPPDFTDRRQTEATEDKGPVTSARNAMMAEDRKALGLDAHDSPERRGWQAALDTAVARGIPERARDIAAEVIAKPRPLTDIETAGMVHAATTLKNRHRALMDEIGATADPAEIQGKAAEAGRIEAEFDSLSTALKQAGTEQGRSLASRKLTLDQDYSLVAMKSRAKAAKGAELTPAESAKITELSKQMEQANKRLAEVEKQLAESRAEQTIKRESGRRRTKPTRDAEFKSLLAEAKSLLEKGCD